MVPSFSVTVSHEKFSQNLLFYRRDVEEIFIEGSCGNSGVLQDLDTSRYNSHSLFTCALNVISKQSVQNKNILII